MAWCVAGMWACSAPTGCACGGFTPLPQGSFQGEKINSAGAARLSAHGFTTLNQNSASILEFFAPGGVMQVPVPCSIEQVSFVGIPVVQIVVADTGSLYCTQESCGRMNGACTADDVGQPVTITFNSLSFAPRGPDILEARVNASVQTGRIPISSLGSNRSLLCGFDSNPRAKFTVDLDTARAQPPTNDLALDIKFAINTRWDQLLSLEVANVGNTAACSGATMAPNCIDPNDIEILNEGCSSLDLANLGAVKTLLIGQLTASLRTQLTDALSEANCASCGPMGECPQFNGATSSCEVDAGVCLDSMTNKCVPALLGVEGRLEIATALAALGAPAGSAIELSLGAGGNAEASSTGLTAGLRGGAKEVVVADCVAPVTRPSPPLLPLPDFELDAPGTYDVGLSVSNQLMTELLFHAQQSGALCLELGTETVAQLNSELLGTLLPSLNKLTENRNVPLRVVIRPVNAPSVVVGEGTVDGDGRPLDPLLQLKWPGLQLDVYADIEDRFVRLLTVTADLSLPLGVTHDGCSTVTPVVGSLTGAITNVRVSNSELLAENANALANLVPSLLSLAEPQLATGLAAFTVPEFNGFQLQLVGARGIGRVAGSNTFNHAALYANLLADGQVCNPVMKRAAVDLLGASTKGDGSASLEVRAGRQYSWRVDKGLWSTWQAANDSRLKIEHPRLRFGGLHVIDVRTPEGDEQRVFVE